MANVLERNILSDHGEFILTGDFNIHMDKPHLSNTILFNDLLESFNLANRVAFSTHLSQHTIDLMLFKTQSTVVSAIRQGHLFSNHYFIHADLFIKTTNPMLNLYPTGNLKTFVTMTWQKILELCLSKVKPLKIWSPHIILNLVKSWINMPHLKVIGCIHVIHDLGSLIELKKK